MITFVRLCSFAKVQNNFCCLCRSPNALLNCVISFHTTGTYQRTFKQRSGKPKIDAIWSGIMSYSAIALGIGLLVTEHLVSCTGVTGRSMQPTINPDELAMKDWVLLDKRASKDLSLIARGDIVTYRTLRDPTEINIKRVVALEGDRVTTLGYRNRTVLIPPGHCWVEGDNHLASDDSNRIGPVPLGLITGRATVIMFPVSRWQRLSRKFPHSRVKLNPNCNHKHVTQLPTIASPNADSKRL